MLDVIGVHVLSLQVCTDETDMNVIARLANEKHPTGISSDWFVTYRDIEGGQAVPCSEHPGSGRRHYILDC